MRIEKNPMSESVKMQKAFQKEKVTFKELNFNQKMEYIWDYYKWWFVFAACFITLAATTIPAIIENNKEVVLYSVFLNSELSSQEENAALMDDFIDDKGIDIDGKRYTIDTSMRISRTMTDQFSMESSQKMLALFSARKMDVVVEDQANLDFYAKEGAFADLTQILTADQLKRYSSLLYTTNGVDGTGVYGVDITDSPILQEEGAYNKDTTPVYFSITTSTEHVENALAFLDYLMGY